MTFQDAKNEYERQREQERVSLVAYLAAHEGIKAAGLHVVTAANAGKGRPDYTAHGMISAFDLRNWKWVEVKGEKGFSIVISLNMLDVDPSTHNIHSLYDRIGLVLSPDPAGWVYTDIDLPLDEADKEQIAQLVLEQYKIFCEKKEVK